MSQETIDASGVVDFLNKIKSDLNLLRRMMNTAGDVSTESKPILTALDVYVANTIEQVNRYVESIND